MRWRGARAVVTGGASGLELAVAHRLVELDAGGRAAPPSAGRFATRCCVSRGRHGFSEGTADHPMTEAAVNALRRLTLAVNCAGISQRGRVDLVGTFAVCRAAANILQHNDPERGTIIIATMVSDEAVTAAVLPATISRWRSAGPSAVSLDRSKRRLSFASFIRSAP
ncbi:MAG: hypothetical protein ACREA0_33840 [bacterium]